MFIVYLLHNWHLEKHTHINKPGSPALQADSLPSEPPGKPKGNHKQNEKKIHTMGENIFKQSEQQGLKLQNIQAAHADPYHKQPK